MKKILFATLLMGFLFSCSEEDSDSESREFVSRDVSVGIKSGTDIQKVFDFINQFDHKVDNINSLTFTSDLPPDHLQLVIDKLNEKEYTNDGQSWFVNGYLHYQSNQITIFPRLFAMHERRFQEDWKDAMNEYLLNDKHSINLTSGIIRFKVTAGEEKQWKSQFERFDIFKWAELNYIAEIELHNQ